MRQSYDIMISSFLRFHSTKLDDVKAVTCMYVEGVALLMKNLDDSLERMPLIWVLFPNEKTSRCRSL